jgi:Uma2 family endonuclease
MATELRWTSADLEVLPENGKRYEIIEGELYMSKQPHWHHQMTCSNCVRIIGKWNSETGMGFVNFAPGIIFADDDDVAPDVVWISKERMVLAWNDGKLTAAPELVIEVLSPGSQNAKRDRETKLKLYSRRGVSEYWIMDWMKKMIEVYRRENAALHLVETLFAKDTLETPLLPGFKCQASEFFEDFFEE